MQTVDTWRERTYEKRPISNKHLMPILTGIDKVIEVSVIAELVQQTRNVCFGRSVLSCAGRAVTLVKRDQNVAGTRNMNSLPIIAVPLGLANTNTGQWIYDVMPLVTMAACVPTLFLYYRSKRWTDLVSSNKVFTYQHRVHDLGCSVEVLF